MRILIVEDEKKTREGLINMIQKFTNHEICGFAINGIEGAELAMKLHPDVILTDIQMPGMDGLEMLKQLVDQGIFIPSLILTGHASFEYARKALYLGVINYILKPVDLDSFIETLSEAESKIVKERAEKISPTQLIWSIMTCESCKKEQMIEQLMKQLLVTDRMEVSMFLIKPSSLNQETAGEMITFLKYKIDSIFTIKYFIVHLSFSYGILVLFIDTEKQKLLRNTFSSHILAGVLKIGDCQCSYTRMNGLRQIECLIHQLKDLLAYSFALGVEDIIDQGRVDELKFNTFEYPDFLENKIRKEIINGDYEKAQDTCNHFKEKVIDSQGNPELIREFTARFASGIYAVSKEYGNRREVLFHHIVNDIIESKSKVDLLHNYEKVVKCLVYENDEKPDIDNHIVQKVINYIREHFQEDITLTEVANLVGVTPEYLSKLFNQIIHVNFIAFLRDYRISEAKRMLLTGKYQVKEVANHVGFNDTKYFNKVFKSVCGVSPSEFKKVI